MPDRELEVFASTVNDSDKGLPKSRGRCFDIGIWGGCGITCAAFYDGECGEPQEIEGRDVIDEYGEREGFEVLSKYSCFDSFVESQK